MQCDALLPMLITAGCATAIGTDIFQDFMPASCVNGILLLSPLGGNHTNWELGPRYHERDTFQMIVRNTSRQNGMTLALQATKALTILAITTLPALNTAPAMQLQYMRPIAEPIVYPRQIDKGWEVSTNFEATYAQAS